MYADSGPGGRTHRFPAMPTHSLRALLVGTAMVLLPAAASAHATVDIGVTMHAPDAVAAGSPFVITTELTDYAHDAGIAIVVQFKFPPGLQLKSVNAPGWRNCAPFKASNSDVAVFTCSADSIPPGLTAIELNVIAPAAPGSIDIQANQLSIANFDPYSANDRASVHIHVYDPPACSNQGAVISGPSDGSALRGGHVDMSWSSVAGSAGYRIWTAVEGADPTILAEISGLSFAADVPVGSTEWWVDALFDPCPTISSNHSRFVSNGQPLQWSVADFAGQAGVRGDHDGAAGQATFETPSSLGIDIYGEIIVIDSEASTLRTIAANGTVSTFAGQADKTGSLDSTQSFSLMNHPEAIAVAPGGFAYIADSANDVIRQYFPNGDGITYFTAYLGTIAGSAGAAGSQDGQGTAARFNGPAGVAVMPDFTVFVSDTMANRIRRISSAGVVASLTDSSIAGFRDGNAADARFNRPTGLAVDHSGNLLIADTGNHVIRRLGTDGNVTTIAGTPGVAGFSDGRGGGAMFNQPTTLTIDAFGNLYVADTGNHAIRLIAPSGLVTTMIGTGSPGYQSGPGRTAMLNMPTGLAIDTEGRLLIADGGNRVVRVATPAAQPASPTESKPRRRAAAH
jgi:sugar lactone lactonase YvrE